ncbi:unnamed protein product, partial [Mesorhabditis spiculigera]
MQIIMAANTPMLLKAGLVEGNTEAGVLASGQVVGMINDLPSCKGTDREHHGGRGQAYRRARGSSLTQIHPSASPHCALRGVGGGALCHFELTGLLVTTTRHLEILGDCHRGHLYRCNVSIVDLASNEWGR